MTINDKIRTQVSNNKAIELRSFVLTKCGCSKPTYYRYLNGNGKDQNIGLAIAEFLQIPFEQLIDPSASLSAVPSTTINA